MHRYIYTPVCIYIVIKCIFSGHKHCVHLHIITYIRTTEHFKIKINVIQYIIQYTYILYNQAVLSFVIPYCTLFCIRCPQNN